MRINCTDACDVVNMHPGWLLLSLSLQPLVLLECKGMEMVMGDDAGIEQGDFSRGV